jgi:dihydrofolate reductase
MSIVRTHLSTTLDGFTSGVNQRLELPFGDGAEHLNDWALKLATVRKMVFGQSGGETGPSDDVFVERFTNIGAFIMGRNMFGGGPGPWKQEPEWKGWWGEEPPYHAPVYVLTHYARPPLELKGGTTFHFVTDGIESALAKAKASAGKKDVVIAGGAHTVQQCLALGALDELELHLVPMLMGAGDRWFDNVPASKLRLEQTRVVVDTGVTHLRYRVLK